MRCIEPCRIPTSELGVYLGFGSDGHGGLLGLLDRQKWIKNDRHDLAYVSKWDL